MINYPQQAIAELIKQTVEKCYNIDIGITDLIAQISIPPKQDMGHYAFACFPLAKILKKSPPQIATELIANLKITDVPLITSFKQFGPYVNFNIGPKILASKMLPLIYDGSFFNNKLCKSKRIMFEYSQPNTHKELHVGHMRNLCYGNALVRINRYVGHQVFATTYPGDVGTHVAKCLWYLKNKNQENIPENDKGTWLSTIYVKGNAKLEEEKGSEKEAANKEEMSKILKAIKNKSGEYYDLWKETREWSLDLLKRTYEWADVKFDRWYFESEEDLPGLERAKKYLKEGILIEDNGAIGMDLSEDNLGFCMLIKSDGNGLYATKDIELAHRKFSEFSLDESIYITDLRQEHHFKQVFKVLEKIGFPHAKNCLHLKYNYVELPTGLMSSRGGNAVPLMNLIHEMEKTIKERYLEKYRGEWSTEEIDQTARDVARGAILYGMISTDSNKKIVFDMHEWLKLDGETGPYLQYVHARISSLLDKQLKENTKINFDSLNRLNHKAEESLILHLNEFNSTVKYCCENHKTSTLCAYLYDLGKLFNNFYVECPIGKEENQEIKAARIGLVACVGLTMKNGLELLGIPAPKRM